MIFLLSDKNNNLYINPKYIVRINESNDGIVFQMITGEQVELEITLDEFNQYITQINNSM